MKLRIYFILFYIRSTLEKLIKNYLNDTSEFNLLPLFLLFYYLFHVIKYLIAHIVFIIILIFQFIKQKEVLKKWKTDKTQY